MTGERPRLADRRERWPVLASHHLHRDEWVVSLRADQVTAPGGGEAHRRLTLEHPGAAVVLALDDDHRVLCLWQYRHPAEHVFVELPAGLLDGGDEEQPLDVARRELLEEAGLHASEWTPLASFFPSPGISAERHHYFVARGLQPADRGDFEPALEEAEMEVGWVPFEDLHAAVVEGRLADAPLAVGVLLARARRIV